MNSEQLSNRLETVAGFIPAGARLADIGSDHAYLPCYLAKKGRIASAIAGEVVEGPFLSAKNQVAAESLGHLIDVRLGSGLEVIKPNEVDCISIAGMGGALISDILEAGKEKLSAVKRLVLQPNVGSAAVRTWLYTNGWELIHEAILEEDGKIYEVLAAEKGNPGKPYSSKKEIEFLMGPFLLKRKEDAFMKKWHLEIENWRRIISQLMLSKQSGQIEEKREELLKKINAVEEVLKDEKSEWA